MDKKVFVLGERDAVLGFSLVGIEGLATDDPAVAQKHLAELQGDPDVGLVLVTTGLAGRMRPTIEKMLAAASLPLIIEIPERQRRLERPPLRDLLRRALGVSV
jgi:vacuolar-type H+-ATPase subunit F/Vma7